MIWDILLIIFCLALAGMAVQALYSGGPCMPESLAMGIGLIEGMKYAERLKNESLKRAAGVPESTIQDAIKSD